MSLLNFPPLKEDLSECYAIQDVHGRLSHGSKEDISEFMRINLKIYPILDKSKLQQMQHSLSSGNLENAFRQNSSMDKVSKLARIWNRKGTSGVVGYMVGGNENKLGKLVRSVSFGFLAPMEDIEKAAEVDSLYEECCSTLNWKTNWIRCVAWHPLGNRLAICQPSDYIRVFKTGDMGSPLTLQHQRQKCVSTMSWQALEQGILAVGCRDCVLIWRIPTQMRSNRLPSSCAQIIEDPVFSPVTDLYWDQGSFTSLFVCSVGSSRVQMYDVLNEEHASIRCGECVARLYPSKSGNKITVAMMNNSIKVFDKLDWTYEKWGELSGKCNAAVWTLDESYLLFTTTNAKYIYYIRFDQRGGTSRSFGISYASVVFDVSELLMTDMDGDISDRAVGGVVKNMVMSDDGNRLAVSFQENPKHIALFMVESKPLLNLIPSTLIEAPEFGIATNISFVPEFPNGSLLCIIWSEGQVQYLPIAYGQNSTGFSYTSYCSLNCSSFIGGLPGSSAISPEPAENDGDGKENLSERQLLKLSKLERSLSPSNKSNPSIRLFSSGLLSSSGMLNQTSFHSFGEDNS